MGITIDGRDRLVRRFEQMGDASNYIPAMQKACRIVETKAKQNCTGLFERPTGVLKASITHEVIPEGNKIVGYVGTNIEYAPYVEFGTGKFAENGNGRKTPWVYTDEATGEKIWTAGQKPKPYLRPALTESKSKIKDALKQSIKNGGDERD